MKKPAKLPKCRTPEECEAIARGMKDAYQKGRRFRRVGFDRKGEPKT